MVALPHLGRGAFIDFDLLTIVILAGQQELAILHILLTGLVGDEATIFYRLLHLLDAVSIPQCVQRMLRARIRRGHIGNHGCPAVAGEAISEHLRQLAAAERQVLLLQIERPDTLLQS